MAVLTERAGDVVVVIPEGMLRGDKETDQLQYELLRQLEGGQKKILLDLKNTTHLNSMAIGILARIHASAVNRGARFSVCNVEKRIQNMLTIVRLVNVLDVHGTREDALKALAA
jgi:anti-anti-sigma factor